MKDCINTVLGAGDNLTCIRPNCFHGNCDAVPREADNGLVPKITARKLGDRQGGGLEVGEGAVHRNVDVRARCEEDSGRGAVRIQPGPLQAEIGWGRSTNGGAALQTNGAVARRVQLLEIVNGNGCAFEMKNKIGKRNEVQREQW